jgi:hypothetical protein
MHGAHITASLNLRPLLTRLRPNCEARAEFMHKVLEVKVVRPAEGIGPKREPYLRP